MKFEIKFSSQGERFIKKLGRVESLRVLDKFEEVSKSPFRYLKHYEGEGYKIRIGDYRAIVDVDFKMRVLLVRFMDKRSRVYK